MRLAKLPRGGVSIADFHVEARPGDRPRVNLLVDGVNERLRIGGKLEEARGSQSYVVSECVSREGAAAAEE